MRLIDADVLIEVIKEMQKAYPIEDQRPHARGMRVALIDCRNLIDNQPTAYDVSKVIEELNKEQEVWLRGYEQTLSMGLEHLWRNLSGRALGVARAIDIVRRGE